MKILLVATGSRGDAQPFVALARGLRLAGHDAILGAPESSKELAESYGVPFFSLDDVAKKMMTDPDRSHFTGTEKSGRKNRMNFALKYIGSLIAVWEQVATLRRVGPDIVVHHCGLPGHYLAEGLDVPSVPVLLQPGAYPTKLMPHPFIGGSIPRFLNRASHRWFQGRKYIRLIRHPTLAFRYARAVSALLREHFCIPRQRGGYLRNPFRDAKYGRSTMVLQAFSQHVLPGRPDFPKKVRTTGYWFLPYRPDWQPSEQLREFIAEGQPLICVGFGSIVGADPKRTGRIVAEAVRKAQVRAVVITGWGGIELDELSGDDIFVADQAPFDWLFPQMAAVVHASGAGVSSTALAAGRPQVPCPLAFDQPMWARLMHARGVATAPQPQYQLASDRLADAIRQAVTDESMARRARELAEHIRAEDGVATAVAELEALSLAGKPTRSAGCENMFDRGT